MQPDPSSRAPQVIDMPIYSRTIFFLPLWIADQQGFFRDEALQIAYSEATLDQVSERLRAGDLGINFLGGEAVFADPTGSLRVVAGNAGRLPHFIIAQPGIKTLADLRHANIGVISEHEGTTHVIPTIARAANLREEDYRISAVGPAPKRWEMLQAGTIDAGLQPFPLSYVAEDAGFSNLGWAGTYAPDWQFSAIVANDGWARRNRRAVVGFLRAMRRGTEFMETHRDRAADIAVTELRTPPKYARRAIDEAIRLGILDASLAVNDAGMRRVFDLSPHAPGVTSYDPARFVDETYLQASRQ